MCAALCDIPLAGVRVRDGAAAFHPGGALQNGGFPVGPSRGRGGARQKSRDLCPVVPTQRGPWGIRYDFNCGCRIQLPKGGTFRVTITDAWTGTIFADGEYAGGDRIFTTKKYFVPYIIDIRNNDTGEARQHECMKQITPEQVMRTIMRIPSFAKHMEERNGRKTEEGA